MHDLAAVAVEIAVLEGGGVGRGQTFQRNAVQVRSQGEVGRGAGENGGLYAQTLGGDGRVSGGAALGKPAARQDIACDMTNDQKI